MCLVTIYIEAWRPLPQTSRKVAHGVLTHLQSGGGHAAGVGCLGGSEQQTGLLEDGNGLHFLKRPGGHIGALGNRYSTALDDLLRLAVVISFCVAQGKAMSQGIDQMPRKPSV